MIYAIIVHQPFELKYVTVLTLSDEQLAGKPSPGLRLGGPRTFGQRHSLGIIALLKE